MALYPLDRDHTVSSEEAMGTVILLGDKKMGKGKMYREHKEAVYNT
jgi:hypothetical protein